MTRPISRPNRSPILEARRKPPGEGTAPITVHMLERDLAWVDEYIEHSPVHVTRAAVIRMLITKGRRCVEAGPYQHAYAKANSTTGKPDGSEP